MIQANVVQSESAGTVENESLSFEEAKIVVEKTQQSLEERLSSIKAQSLMDLQKEQEEIQKSFAKLVEITDLDEQARQRDILEARSEKLRPLMLQLTANQSEIVYALQEFYDSVGVQTQAAKRETPEDLKKIADAEALLENAKTALAEAKATLTLVGNMSDNALIKFFSGKEGKLKSAEKAVTVAENGVVKAKKDLVEVKRQVKLDQDERVQNSTLTESFTQIGIFNEEMRTFLRADIKRLGKMSSDTVTSLQSALKKKKEVAEDREQLNVDINKKMDILAFEEGKLGRILDTSSQAYSAQEVVVVNIKLELDDMANTEKELTAQFITLEKAVKLFDLSLETLKTQKTTAEMNLAVVESTEKTAIVSARNIDAIIKSGQHEGAAKGLSQTTDKMLILTAEMAAESAVASGNNAKDILARHIATMDQLVKIEDARSIGVSETQQEYARLDQEIRSRIKQSQALFVTQAKNGAVKVDDASSSDDAIEF